MPSEEMKSAPAGMLRIPDARFRMGSEHHYIEESPEHDADVTGFWIDRFPVTNEDYRRFVDATGYVTLAERELDPEQFIGADPNTLVPGSLVFQQPDGPVDLRSLSLWWVWRPRAHWRQPQGADSSVAGLTDHPVVHVAYEDALAYSVWAGKSLPTETEWEFASRGGLDGAVYTWGDEHELATIKANVWEGDFPWRSTKPHSPRTSPVGSYAANGYGLFDMTGNVWEWTQDRWWPKHQLDDATACCPPSQTRTIQSDERNANHPDMHIPERVLKGGSHLCAPNYCLRYRPAARIGQPVDSATTHIGFRCVLRDAG